MKKGPYLRKESCFIVLSYSVPKQQLLVGDHTERAGTLNNVTTHWASYLTHKFIDLEKLNMFS